MTTETMPRDAIPNATEWMDLSAIDLNPGDFNAVDFNAVEHDVPSSTSSSAIQHLSRDVARYHREGSRLRHALRTAIASRILSGDVDPTHAIDVVLDTLLASPLAGRLDDAIDLLSELGPTVEHYARELARMPSRGDADDDRWYVVIRALGRSGAPTARALLREFQGQCPEAAEEALADL